MKTAKLEVWDCPPDHLCRCSKCGEPMRELVSWDEGGPWYCRKCLPPEELTVITEVGAREQFHAALNEAKTSLALADRATTGGFWMIATAQARRARDAASKMEHVIDLIRFAKEQ